jgi:hypothetical protein
MHGQCSHSRPNLLDQNLHGRLSDLFVGTGGRVDLYCSRSERDICAREVRSFQAVASPSQGTPLYKSRPATGASKGTSTLQLAARYAISHYQPEVFSHQLDTSRAKWENGRCERQPQAYYGEDSIIECHHRIRRTNTPYRPVIL